MSNKEQSKDQVQSEMEKATIIVLSTALSSLQSMFKVADKVGLPIPEEMELDLLVLKRAIVLVKFLSGEDTEEALDEVTKTTLTMVEGNETIN